MRVMNKKLMRKTIIFAAGILLLPVLILSINACSNKESENDLIAENTEYTHNIDDITIIVKTIDETTVEFIKEGNVIQVKSEKPLYSVIAKSSVNNTSATLLMPSTTYTIYISESEIDIKTG